MLTARVLRVGGHAYYLDEPAVPGEPGGAPVARLAAERGWAGTGAVALGLDGELEPTAFADLLRGAHPATHEVLGPRPGVEVGAYDLTFSAPKSVSLLALLGPRELAAAAADAHRAAVTGATAYVERAALRARRWQGGQMTLVATDGAIAGAFGHRTSRAFDPHLHTHLVVANVAHGADGRWTAVDSRRIFAHLRSAGLVYQAALRAELTARAGVAWEVSASGLGDVVGVPAPLRRLFSQRSAAIARHLAAAGGRSDGRSDAPSPTRRGAFYATRPAKDTIASADRLVAEWRWRAADCGFDLDLLGRVVGRGRADGRATPTEAVDRAVGRLEELGAERVVARRDVVAVLAASVTAGARAPELEQAADRLLGRCQVAARPQARTTDRAGTSRASRASEPRWPAASVVEVLRRDGLALGSGRNAVHLGHDVVRSPASRARSGINRGGIDLGR